MVSLTVTCARVPGRQLSEQSQDVLLPRDLNVIEGRVPRAATFETLLRQNAVEPTLASSMVSAMSAVFNPRHLQANQAFRLTRTVDGLLREFRYEIDTSKFLRVVFHKTHEEGQPDFDVEVVPYPRTVSVETASAEISREHPSLIGAFDAAGENQQLPMALAEMFGGEIDFNTEMQRGDKATVLFERITRDGEFVGYGSVQAAILEHGGKRFVGVLFTGPSGKSDWYDEQGRSLKREFLKSPLPFEPRITSRFSNRRLHPVFGDFRAHLGVDYAAPEGTRVVAVSAGTIESAGWSGDAGRLVVVRHKGGLETMYLHLSSIAEGIHPGAHVSQGQTLGRVGMTGAATGPHLDFRVRKDGKYSNPVAMRAKMPPGDPIGPEQMAAFSTARDAILQQLKSGAAK